MNRKVLIIIALQAFIIVVLFWVLVFYGKDEYEAYLREEQEEEISSESIVATENGTTVINLPIEAQQHSGIVTSTLAAARHRTSLTSFGTVVEIDQLIDLRGRYLAALAEADVIRASMANSQRDYERLAELNRDNRNVSDRTVAAAQATWQTEKAKLVAAGTAAASIRDSMRQQWGPTLTDWATQRDEHGVLQSLLSRQEVLIRISLPEEVDNPQRLPELTIRPANMQVTAIKARYVSAAPSTDSALPGRTFFFRASADNLRSGMRVVASIKEEARATQGIIVPHQAIVWYGGQAWAYLKQGEEAFIRTLVSTEHEAEHGWFNESGFASGDEVVTSGAQLLLSEEFKYQIKNENED